MLEGFHLLTCFFYLLRTGASAVCLGVALRRQKRWREQIQSLLGVPTCERVV